MQDDGSLFASDCQGAAEGSNVGSNSLHQKPVFEAYDSESRLQVNPDSKKLQFNYLNSNEMLDTNFSGDEENAELSQVFNNLLSFRKFYTNRNFNFTQFFTGNHDTSFKHRFTKSMPKFNPML